MAKTDDTRAAQIPGRTDSGLSTQAQFSTYKDVDPDDLDNTDGNPPPGRHVIQELGKPSK